MDDRRQIEEAIRHERNLGHVARRLGVSRRTLQNRMRRAGLPRGRGGRPKKQFRRKRDREIIAGGVVAGIVGAIAYRHYKK